VASAPAHEVIREEQRQEALRREETHVEPVATAPVPALAPETAPVPVSAPVVTPQREQARIDPKLLLESSGLVMVETDRGKAAVIAPPAEEPQRLGRPRRERAKPVAQDEELQQVETRK
jgi:ribonuclease E